MHTYYWLAGDCTCTAKTLMRQCRISSAVENIVRDFGESNPTMLPWRSLAGVVAHLSGDEGRSRSLIEERFVLPNYSRCQSLSVLRYVAGH